MRDIRFRAWDKYKERMIYDVEMEYDGIDLEYFGSCLMNDRYEPMQYIEIKDKNEKEIYEGDIIQFDDGEMYQVYWNEEDASFKMKIISGKEKWSLRLNKTEINTNCSVLGNIYETSKLLEVKNED